MFAREPPVICDLRLSFAFEDFPIEFFFKIRFSKVAFFSFIRLFEICKTKVSFLRLKADTSFFD